MLKISRSSESTTKPGKGGVGVDGDGGNDGGRQVVIPTGSSLLRVRGIQPWCTDIQVFIRFLSKFHPRLQ